MSSESAHIHAIQAVGLASSAFLGGAVLAISYAAIPPLYSAPSPLSAKQWRVLYRKGLAVAPPFAALTSLTFGYLSYTFKQASRPNANFYSLAAALVVGIVPYTLIFMRGINNKLMTRAAEADKLDATEKVTQVGLPKGESTNELLDKWAFHNAVRCVFPLMATALGMWATLA
ncbi:hypothetical protein MMC17_006090 [Xylographa soralifera]|nr:hypothetical protein [Xylographa soralifera]